MLLYVLSSICRAALLPFIHSLIHPSFLLFIQSFSSALNRRWLPLITEQRNELDDNCQPANPIDNYDKTKHLDIMWVFIKRSNTQIAFCMYLDWALRGRHEDMEGCSAVCSTFTNNIYD